MVQTLAEMLLTLENFRFDQHGRASALQQIDLLEESTRKALADLRALLVELRTEPPREQDLVALIRQSMLDLKRAGHGVEFGLQVAKAWPERMPAQPATELHRIVAQALDNAIRHGRAKHIEVSLGFAEKEGQALIAITDDGRGIVERQRTGRAQRFGIVGMRERAGLLGGEISLSAGPSRRGTTVQISVPAEVVRTGQTKG